MSPGWQSRVLQIPSSVEKRIAFQEWGIPDRHRHPVGEEVAAR